MAWWPGSQRFMGILEVDGDEPGTTRLITNQPENYRPMGGQLRSDWSVILIFGLDYNKMNL